MSKFLDDAKSGLKGIRGAGDALRGTVLEASDQAFDSKHKHPASVASQEKHRAIAEQGKQDIRGADEMVARHEWERKGVAPPGAAPPAAHDGYVAGGGTTTTGGSSSGGPMGTAGARTGQYEEAPVLHGAGGGLGGGNTGYDQRDFAPMHEGPGTTTTGTHTGHHEAPMHQAGGVGTGYEQREFAPPHGEERAPPVQSHGHQFEPGSRDNIREGY